MKTSFGISVKKNGWKWVIFVKNHDIAFKDVWSDPIGKFYLLARLYGSLIYHRVKIEI